MTGARPTRSTRTSEALGPPRYKTTIVTVAHRLCRLLYALSRDGTDFQPTRLGVEECPFTQIITRWFPFTPKSAGRLVSA